MWHLHSRAGQLKLGLRAVNRTSRDDDSVRGSATTDVSSKPTMTSKRTPREKSRAKARAIGRRRAAQSLAADLLSHANTWPPPFPFERERFEADARKVLPPRTPTSMAPSAAQQDCSARQQSQQPMDGSGATPHLICYPPAPTAVATLTDSTAVQQQQLLNSSDLVYPQQQHCLNSPLRPPQQVPSHPAASYANHSQSSQQTQFSDRHTPGGFFVQHHL